MKLGMATATLAVTSLLATAAMAQQPFNCQSRLRTA